MNDPAVRESQRLIARRHAARGRRYLKAGAFMLLAMAAGFAIGVGLTVLYMKDKYHRVPPRPDAIAQAMLERMDELLGLAPAEEDQLRNVIHTHMGQVESIRKGSFEEIRGVFRQMDSEFLTILGPERHEVWKEEREKRFHKKRRDRDRERGSGKRHHDRE